MMDELWRDINGYEGYYQISNIGNVRSLDRYINNNGRQVLKKGQPIVSVINGSGYIQCKLAKEGKNYMAYVHKLVAEAFMDNPLQLKELNHIDHNKNNNSISNLEWCTRSENMIKYHEHSGTYEVAKEDNYCECGRQIYKYSEVCTECLGVRNRKTVRPSKEELLGLIKGKSLLQVGKDYSVSDNAVRKWCKSYGLPYKKKDIRLL